MKAATPYQRRLRFRVWAWRCDLNRKYIMKSRSRKPATSCLPRDNRRGDNQLLNRGKLLTGALCVFLALPGMAAAKKASTDTAVSCAVLLPAEIYTGNSFSVKVVRVPSYPGSWTQPTIYTDVAYPTTSDSAITQNDTQTINKFNVTYALATFMVPSMSTSSISSSPTSPEATATVTATVSEPLGNNRVRQTTCSATTAVVGAN
jgi:hypothetical protein